MVGTSAIDSRRARYRAISSRNAFTVRVTFGAFAIIYPQQIAERPVAAAAMSSPSFTTHPHTARTAFRIFLVPITRRLVIRTVGGADMFVRTEIGEPQPEAPASAHVVVIGNEKGGSGKSTTAMHVAIALLKAGQRVATIDLDSRQGSFTHYVYNRRAWSIRSGVKLELPEHYRVGRGESLRVDENEA